MLQFPPMGKAHAPRRLLALLTGTRIRERKKKEIKILIPLPKKTNRVFEIQFRFGKTPFWLLILFENYLQGNNNEKPGLVPVLVGPLRKMRKMPAATHFPPYRIQRIWLSLAGPDSYRKLVARSSPSAMI